MPNFVIELVVTACLWSNPAACSEIRSPTTFVSEVQCQIFGQQALPEIMQAYPKRRVERYKCVQVSTGQDI